MFALDSPRSNLSEWSGTVASIWCDRVYLLWPLQNSKRVTKVLGEEEHFHFPHVLFSLSILLFHLFVVFLVCFQVLPFNAKSAKRHTHMQTRTSTHTHTHLIKLSSPLLPQYKVYHPHFILFKHIIVKHRHAVPKTERSEMFIKKRKKKEDNLYLCCASVKVIVFWVSCF